MADALNLKPAHVKIRGLSLIKESWGIDAATYRKIRTELERDMLQKNILGKRLQGYSAQNGLEEVVAKIQRQILSQGMVKNPNVEQNQITGGLRRMAQILNQNKRRQIYRVHDKPIHSSGATRTKEQESPVESNAIDSNDSSSTACDNKIPAESKSSTPPALCSTLSDFSSTTIFIQRQDANSSVCKPEDLFVGSTGKIRQIHISQLQFERFLRILTDELQYDAETDVLFYNRETGDRICLPTERAWRAALLDMYGDGLRKLDFGIDRMITSEITRDNGVNKRQPISLITTSTTPKLKSRTSTQPQMSSRKHLHTTRTRRSR